MKYALIALLALGLFASACTTDTATPSDTSKMVGPVKEIKITAYQFGFEPSVITLKKGEPVRLTFTSRDVGHGVFLLDFEKATKEFGPGESESIDFVPDKVGTFTYQCSVYCGGGHGQMEGTIIVEE